MDNSDKVLVLKDFELGMSMIDIRRKYPHILCSDLLKLVEGLPQNDQIRFSPKRAKIFGEHFSAQNIPDKRRWCMYTEGALKREDKAGFKKDVMEFTLDVLASFSEYIPLEDCKEAEKDIKYLYFKYEKKRNIRIQNSGK